jgi:bifunctional non-homologous end joining protein LigD
MRLGREAEPAVRSSVRLAGLLGAFQARERAVGLDVYRKKRKFDVTSEPRGGAGRGKGDQFVVQKHDATRLHYDLRLELDGVMKSWAVTRGPSLVPGDKRLAVHVEDHPIEYNQFEGTIPKGEYGGGTVMVWDRGRWTPEGDPHKGLAKGHLEFSLSGEKLTGRWHLVRMHGRPGEKRENWLLIKADDDAARRPTDPEIVDEKPLSVVSGRSIPEIAEGKKRARVWHSTKSVAENVKSGATRTVKTPGGASKRRAATPGPAESGATKSSARKKAAKAKSVSKTKAKAKSKKKKPGAAALPEFVPPSLATLRAVAPTGPGWVHEIKFDGYRIQARLDHGDVRLLTRKGLDWKAKFPNIGKRVTAMPADTALIDGEIVVEDEHGVPNFSMLQAALRDGDTERFVYHVFDLLHRDGRDLMALPLIERKAELKDLLADADPNGPIRFSDHVDDDGALVLRHACQMRLEGIVSKQADAPYRPGRSDAFVKAKCSTAQELVVGGFAASTVRPKAVGALVVGYYDGKRLVYAGRVGTGYTEAVSRDLYKRLHPIERATMPFERLPAEERRRDVHWVEPRAVIESQFRGWTADGMVRQAAFKGVREDKPAREVVRERPADGDPHAGKQEREPAMDSAASAKSGAVKRSAPKRGAAKKTVAKKKTPAKPSAKGAAPAGRDAKATPAAVSDIRFTHPERIYWADVGVTKQDLADFYGAAWERMAPHVVNRPLSFLRCPDGTSGQCFFQKHASAGLDDKHLRSVTDAKRRQVIAIADLDGLLSLVQAGVLEVHVRGSMIDRLDLCDRLVLDLDPGEGVGWKDIVAAARDVRDRLAAIALDSFVKLSGGKGLHVVVPIDGTDWETTKAFAQAFAQAMAADDPERYVATMAKAARGGKIFVDYFRNALEQTSVAVYSTRARDGAPVSVPLSWPDLGRVTGSNQYTVKDASKWLASRKPDPWRDMARVTQALPDLAMLRKRS